MAERFVRWGLGGERVAVSVRGTSPQGAVAQAKFQAVPLVPDPTGGTALVAILYSLWDVELQHVQLRPVAGSGSVVVQQVADAGDEAWLTLLTAVNAVISNNALPCMDPRLTTTAGTTYPWPLVRLDGLALGAHTVPITAVDLDVTYTTLNARNAWGPLEFGTLVEDTISTLPDVGPALDALLPQILNAPGSVSLGTGATGDVLVSEVGLAALAPDRVVWLRPGDVGNASYQIPVAAVNNNASHYKFFPSFFLRRCAYERDVHVSGPIEPSAVTSLAGALPLVEVTRRPTHSRWLLTLDGQTRDVCVSHGALDLRKPLEIWQAILAPAVRAGSIDTFGIEVTGPARTFPRQGVLKAMSYLDAARFLEPLDENAVTSCYAPLAQT